MSNLEKKNIHVNIPSILLRERLIFLFGPIDVNVAQDVITKLIYLESENDSEPITLYVSSPGGDLSAALSIIDTMNWIKPEVAVVNMGACYSAGSLILASGAKGKRYSLTSSKVMVHQPLTGTNGMTKASDFEVISKELNKTKETCINIYQKTTGLSKEKICEIMSRDSYFTSEEAKELGFIDEILVKE